MLKALQPHTEVPQNVLPGAERCGYSERAEEHPLKYGGEMKGVPVYQIHLFNAPSSLPWILSLGFSALQVQKASPIFAVPRWLAHWLEPEGKRRKRRTPQVNPVRDQISHRMQGSTATPVEEKLEMEEAGGAIRTCQGLSQSNPIGITPHHAPTIAPTTGYSRARSVSVRGLFKLWSMGGGG